MKQGIILILFITLLLVTSCEKDFNINPQNTGNDLVINSLFNNGSPITVYVSKSYPVGSINNYMTAIPDAKIELYENNILKEIMPYVPSDTQALFGAYVSNTIPQVGKSYTIKVSDKNYLSATATDTIPMPTQIITSAIEKYATSGPGPRGKMYMVFKDDPAVQNYYRINAWAFGQLRTISSGDTTYSYQYEAIEPYATNEVSDTVRDGYFLLFSDKGFNGQEKNLELTFSTINPRNYVYLNLYIELHTVSKAHSQYFKTLNTYRTSSSTEPVFVFSNVNNGLGAFVAENIQTMTFVIK